MNLQWRVLAACFAALLVGTWSFEAQAQRNTAQIPVQVGVGPSGSLFAGPTFSEDSVGWGGRLAEDRVLHTGLRLSLTAVIQAELVRRHPGLVPRQYRQQVINSGEVRYAPGIVALIPDTIYISPPIPGVDGWDSQAYGATWSLMALGLPFITNPFRVSARGALIASAIYINSETVGGHYFFLRPGAELKLEVEIPLTNELLVSFGWASMFHVPQSLDESFVSPAGFDENSLWHIGQFFFQGHFRIPYSYQYR